MKQSQSPDPKPKPLTEEERGKLLARVYAIILSPEWGMEEAEPQLLTSNSKQSTKKSNE